MRGGAANTSKAALPMTSERTETRRETTRQLYIRICQDSGFTLPFHRAVKLTADVLGIHPIDVWASFPYMQHMEWIADGTHPFLERPNDR